MNDVDISRLASKAAILDTKYKNKFEDVAYELRNCVMSLGSKNAKFPRNCLVSCATSFEGQIFIVKCQRFDPYVVGLQLQGLSFDCSEIQNIEYLPPINLSQTS